MSQIQIHQFSPAVHKGDGISNGMFYLQKTLRDLGFISNIYVDLLDPELKNSVLSHNDFNTQDSTQILMIHYSLYYDFSQWIDTINVRKIMVYHNITPYKFFEEGSTFYTMCKKGKEYLPELRSRFEASIGDSKLNSEELLEHNFSNVKTIPLLMDTDKILNAPWNKNLFDEKAAEFSILFIGRIARNKAQLDLIEIANVYKNMCDDFKLYIIGGTTDLSYQIELQNLIASYHLEENVILTGKVSDEDLFAYYRSANLFLCMSEHEGFGIPLIESMLLDVPVIAFNSSNIKSTLNGGGILFDTKSYEYIAATIALLRRNPAFRREILTQQKEARKVYYHPNIVQELVTFLESLNVPCHDEVATLNKSQSEKSPSKTSQKVRYQFEGPFDSSYSLAMLNRYAALAFEANYPNEVSLFATEGNGDYEPNRKFLKTHPQVAQLSKRSEKAMPCEVVFRNMYPPRVTGMKGALNLLNAYGWEESYFPKAYVDNFNDNLDGITVMSEYVKKVLQNNGVTSPIAVVGLGVEHVLEVKAKPIKLDTQKRFKFLHVSSAFPRKGIDVLLKAYAQAFTQADDVTLILKTFPNPHNDIEQQIEAIQKENPNIAEILLINEDLEEAKVVWLYQNTHCLVAPSRGEGFGLPMAEAMLFHLPVITTGFGGQTDFCTEETAWLIDYAFAKAKTHLSSFDSYWVEPDTDDLTRLLQEQLELSDEEKRKKTHKAHELISQKFRWEDYRQKSDAFIESLKTQTEIFDTKVSNIAWVSSYNTKCGIASYSKFILERLHPSKFNVIPFANKSHEILDPRQESGTLRCWNNQSDKSNQELITQILTQKNLTQKNIDSVMINFNFGFFSMPNLKQIVEALETAKIKTNIIFHSVADVEILGERVSLLDIQESLKKVDNLLVHTIEDLNFLKDLGLHNTTLLPHGVQNRQQQESPKETTRFTIASYGFLLPHKGILELIEAFALVQKQQPHSKLLLVNALYPIPDSQAYYQVCQDKINALNLSEHVEFQVEFLSEEESFALLNRADLLVMPYRYTQESSSAAVREAVATMNPVLCTPQPIFNDVNELVHFTAGDTPEEMANAILALMENERLLHANAEQQALWIEEHDWDNVALKIEKLLV